MSSKWEIKALAEILDINPTLKLPKGKESKKVAMEYVAEFTKKIQGYEIVPFTSGSKFQNKDILMARITPCLENGKTAFVDILDEGEIAFGSTEFFVLRAKEGIADPKFIYYLAISDEIRTVTIKSMTGTSGRQRAQKEALLEYKRLIPNLSTQKKIGEVLSLFDEKIECNNQIIDNLEALSAEIFKRWFIDFEFLNEQGLPYRSSGGEMVVSKMGEIPKGWEIRSLDSIAEYKNGLAMQKYRPNENEDFLPVVKIKELNQGNTNIEGEKCSIKIPDSVKINDGDVIFSWSGTLLVKIWAGGEAGLNQHLFKVTSQEFSKWFYYLWTKYHLREFISIAQSKATTMGHIKRSHLADAKVLVPDEKKLREAENIFTPIINHIINISIENKNLIKLRDSLLPQILSGEIKIPDESVVEPL